MKKNETYFVAKLLKKGEFLSSEIFESLEEARLWAMKETKLLISDTFLKTCKVDDVVVEIGGCQVSGVDVGENYNPKWQSPLGTVKYNKDAFIVIKNRSRTPFTPSQANANTDET